MQYLKTKEGNLKNQNNGITLIALVVTIIVLLILAGVSIAMLTGDNGILKRAGEARDTTGRAQIAEELQLAINAVAIDYYKNFASTGSSTLRDYIFLSTTQTAINSQLSENASYDATNKKITYKQIEFSVDEKGNVTNSGTSGSTENEGNSSGEENLNQGGSDSNGSQTPADTQTGGNIQPTSTSVVDDTTTFSTEYGKVDVIWLSGTGNTVSSTPNTPNLSGMTPVSWTKSGDEWTEDATASASYYSYEAGSGNSDNTSSRWANAKNSDGSYFVWIPRFAYRITYYSSQSSTEPTGYYDGWGQWKASDGKVRLALDSGIETVEYGGNKYIVHPAFCGESVGYDNGSWSNAISGFWVAKYEMSRTGATSSSAGSGYNTTFLSVPNVKSARSITIGNMYNVAKSYDSSKESHLMKNSEWGAVAYLTQSQYGRNGNEIDINNSSSYITGNGGGSTSASSTSGTPNPYNTTTGAKASTTGNVYGVYDMSGGAWEYVAAFNNTDTNNYESSYGSTFASTSGTSDKYATKYYNETTSSNGNARIYTYGKIGDATKEVNKGGAYALSNTSKYYKWFEDYPSLCIASAPFVRCGGYCGDGANAGVFSSFSSVGYGNSYYSFRAVLCP